VTQAPGRHELPNVDTHTAEFLNSPNSVLGAGPGRPAAAGGRAGPEFFSASVAGTAGGPR
jgi:hypothetical protein